MTQSTATERVATASSVPFRISVGSEGEREDSVGDGRRGETKSAARKDALFHLRNPTSVAHVRGTRHRKLPRVITFLSRKRGQQSGYSDTNPGQHREDVDK